MTQRHSRGDTVLPPADPVSEEAARHDSAGRSARARSGANSPSSPADRFESAIQLVSRAAGPLALIAVLIGLFLLIF